MMVKVGRSTVIVKSQVLVLLQPSLAVTWTVFVVPRANVAPEGGDEVTRMFVVQLSVAVTVQVTVAFVPQVWTTMLLGQTIVGGMVSTTVTC